MSNAKALAVVFSAAAIGMVIGIAIANWHFGGSHYVDVEVLRAARILLGWFGAAIFGYTARTMIMRRIVRQS
jgi:hypothetical protein